MLISLLLRNANTIKMTHLTGQAHGRKFARCKKLGRIIIKWYAQPF